MSHADIMPKRQKKAISRVVDVPSYTPPAPKKELSTLPIELFEKIVGEIAFIYLPHFIQCSKGLKVHT